MRKLIILMLLSVRLAAAQPADEQLSAWAGGLAAAFASGEGERAMTAAIDIPQLVGRSLEGLEVSAGQRRDLIAGVSGGFALTRQIAAAVAAGGSYRYRRLVTRPEGRRPLFRMMDQDGNCNWHELVMGTGPDGKPRIVDLHIYMTGELLSTTMRGTFAVLLPNQGGFFARLLGGGATGADVEAFSAVTTAFQKQDWRGVLARSDAMPDRMRSLKMLGMLRIQAAQKLDQATYLKELEAFGARNPDDPALLLMSIDTLFMQERFDKLKGVLARLSRLVGEDAQIDVIRANIALTRGDLAASQAEAIKATTHEDDWTWAWNTRLGVDLKCKDNADIVRCLDRLTGLGTHFKPLAGVAGFADFAASPEYAAWLQRQPQTP